MNTKHTLQTLCLAAAGLCAALPASAAQVAKEAPGQAADLYPISSVRLLDGYFQNAAEANRKYLLDVEPDRLLAPFLREAGLEPKAKNYGNWESSGLDGHTAGHYIAGLALMIAAGDDADGEMNRRLDYMLNELERCQKAYGDGYIGGVPGSRELWDKISSGNVGAVWNKWVPWYNVHKTFAGLRDAYFVADKEKARDLLVKLGDWCVNVTSGLSDGQMQQMLGNEYGGMNEVMADIYAITGDEKYLKAAERFNHRSVMDPLVEHQDKLTGLHANTQIPKIIGMERIAALTENAQEHSGAEFFWETVTEHRCIAFGGNSVSEHFNATNDFIGMVNHREGPETCNTYNMLRLTEQLFVAEPKAEYVDFYERALYNHILASINVETPGYVYFTSIRPEHYRVYSTPENCFWCCVGTGMENPGRYGQFIYAHDDDGVFVNLFIPSEVKASEGVVLRQETKFPYNPSTKLTLKMEKSSAFVLRVRHPDWVPDGELKVKVNGRSVAVNSTPSSYVELDRTWKNGDVVEVAFTMHTRVERLPDESDWVSILYGPIVLAHPSGTDRMDGLFADDARFAHVAAGPMVPMDQVPTLTVSEKDLTQHVKLASSAKPLTFVLSDVIYPDAPEGLSLEPFFSLHEQRYQIYFELSSAEKIAARREALAAAERARVAREAATIDQIAPGEQQPEVEHDFKGEETETGIYNGRRWRHGRMIQYSLALKGEKAVVLEVTYSGNDSGRTFDIFVDGTQIATQKLTGEKAGEFISKRYPVPTELINAAANGRITVKFVATEYLAGGLYDVRLMKAE